MKELEEFLVKQIANDTCQSDSGNHADTFALGATSAYVRILEYIKEARVES
ncbi:hypothetical protein SEA_WEASELS2_248 [Rhodococcus phage Weasels2]|uniref:Uncharacterized protein n=1 Tax=Rhodococcus phage Weasels2 TaxID=1897437 RepID=A0A1I9SAM0_9CAUD|nr:hypothetical protein FDH04_gp168 [Rhodococcus phage Weasels2]AOZ63826.1 hypothetical protein SEA_WEASELS2_248 [Rhodococcus phage Weasels2]